MLTIRLRSLVHKRSVQILVVLVLFSLLLVGLRRTVPSSSSPTLESTTLHSQSDLPAYGHQFEAALVVASQRKDNTTWLQNRFQSWEKLIYVVDDARASLTVPFNKGREAMVYLTYMIDHYDSLQDVSIFVHAERFQWHNDDPDYDGQRILGRLNLSLIRAQRYANLRCAWVLGCPAEIHPFKDSDHISVPPTTGEVYKQSFEKLFPGQEVPETVGTTCCAQFAVSKEAIRSRPIEDYVRYRQWIIETDLADDLSGRVLEYSWHIIFGKEAFFCPNAQECYCNLYGLCDLECKDERSCKDRYTLPPYSTLPEGWPEVGWNGEVRQLNEV